MPRAWRRRGNSHCGFFFVLKSEIERDIESEIERRPGLPVPESRPAWCSWCSSFPRLLLAPSKIGFMPSCRHLEV